MPRPVLVYALGTMGFHIFNFVEHVYLKDRQSDFYEMLLHHIATCSLYFCMIYGNNMGVGCMIAYLHDIADIFANLIKCISTTHFDKAVVPVFVLMMVTWAWTRLYVLPQIVLFIFRYDNEELSLFVKINGVFLSVLIFLHFFWFSLFIKMLYVKARTGVAEDIQNAKKE